MQAQLQQYACLSGFVEKNIRNTSVNIMQELYTLYVAAAGIIRVQKKYQPLWDNISCATCKLLRCHCGFAIRIK